MSSTRRAAIILNPVKVPDVDKFRHTVDAALAERGFDDSLWLETTEDDAGSTMAKRAIEESVDLVVVAGGDGTVRVACAELARSGIPVAVLPAGTGNLLARNLGISLDIEIALTELLTLRNLNHPFVRVEIIVDDRPPVRRRARTVVIGNVGTLQANIPLLPDAVPDDGLIDAVVLAPRRISQWPRLAASLVVKSLRERHVERFTGERIQVTAAKTVRRQLDGDTIADGRTLSASVDPSTLIVRVP